MIESTEAEQLAYARAMVHELEIAEKERMRQQLLNPWIKVENLYKRIQHGLQCTRDEARELLLPVWHQGILEANKTKRYVRIVGGRV